MADGTEENPGIVAAREPLFLLPAAKAGCAVGDGFDDLFIDVAPVNVCADRVGVGEVCAVFFVGLAVGDAPGANLPVQFFFSVNGSNVDVSARGFAADAGIWRGFDAFGGDWVGMIFEGWERLSHR